FQRRRRGHPPSCVRARLRRHRLEATRLALSLRPCRSLAQNQESGRASREARGRGGLGRQATGVRAAKDAMSDRTHQRRRLVLCKGTTRAVLVVGPWALKFAGGERGRRCNRFEALLYKRVDARRRAMLCPVLWCTRTDASC